MTSAFEAVSELCIGRIVEVAGTTVKVELWRGRVLAGPHSDS